MSHVVFLLLEMRNEKAKMEISTIENNGVVKLKRIRKWSTLITEGQTSSLMFVNFARSEILRHMVVIYQKIRR